VLSEGVRISQVSVEGVNKPLKSRYNEGNINKGFHFFQVWNEASGNNLVATSGYFERS
jgi:hypothetical protein